MLLAVLTRVLVMEGPGLHETPHLQEPRLSRLSQRFPHAMYDDQPKPAAMTSLMQVLETRFQWQSQVRV